MKNRKIRRTAVSVLSVITAAALAGEPAMQAALAADSTATPTATPTAKPLTGIKSSDGSAAEDGTAATPAGKDSAQGKATEYSEVQADSAAQPAEVYVTQAASFSIKIPKILILDGQTGKAGFTVSAKGDLTGKAYIDVIPEAAFWMYDKSGVKSPKKAYVKQAAEMFTSSNLTTVPKTALNTLNEDTWTDTAGTVTCDGISAGMWSGAFNFVIGAFDDFEHPAALATDGTVMKLAADSMYIGAEYYGVKDAAVNLSTAADTSSAEATAAPTATPTQTASAADILGALSLAQKAYAADSTEAAQAVAAAAAADPKSVTWASSDPDVIKVDENGGVSITKKAVAGDTADITATYGGYVSDTPGINDREAVSLSFPVTVFDIKFGEAKYEAPAGSTLSVDASVYPASAAEDVNLDWSLPDAESGLSITEKKDTSDGSVANLTIPADAEDTTFQVEAKAEDYGKSAVVNVPAVHKHTYELTSKTDPTCTQMGETVYTCTSCAAGTEGHSYSLKEPALGHEVGSDGHHCSRCGALVVPYKKGDIITRTVMGQSLDFYCADPAYTDASGKKGAYFLAMKRIDGVDFTESKISPYLNTWESSTSRAKLNGSNSDKTYLMATDTTVTNISIGDDPSKMGTRTISKSDFTWTTYSPAKTLDYYFLPSLEEMCRYSDFLYAKDGRTFNDGERSDFDEHDNIHYNQYWLRDPSAITYNGKLVRYENWMIETHEKYVWSGLPGQFRGWGYGDGIRPACVIEQTSEETPETTWKMGDVTYRKVAGQETKFTCINPDYRDATGNDIGALFLSNTVFGSEVSAFDSKSNAWADSSLRTYLNGSDSDTSGLIQADTTVKQKVTAELNNANGGYIQWLNPEDISAAETKDYYFPLSVQEILANSSYMMSTDGINRDLRNAVTGTSFGYYTRTPSDLSDRCAYVYTATKNYRIMYRDPVYSSSVGFRPACVLPHKS